MILGWRLLLTPSVSLVNLSVIPVAWRPPPPVFGVELAGLFKDPSVYVSMISWFIGVAVNLQGRSNILSRLDGSSRFALNGFFR